MARSSRDTTNKGAYHVMMRGNNHQDIFLDIQDRFRFLDYLDKILKNPMTNNGTETEKIEVYAYALMSNHFHILVRVQSGNIGDFVKRLASSYVVYFNNKYQRDGHLFKGRFKSEVCEDNEYFMTLLRYIHQNPIKAGLCTDLMKYAFTSWPEYVGAENYPYHICSVETVLEHIPLKNLTEMVYALQPDNLKCIDVDKAVGKISDDSAAKMLKDVYNIDNREDINLRDKVERRQIIQSLLEYGASISQIHKLTGITKSTISAVNNKIKS